MWLKEHFLLTLHSQAVTTASLAACHHSVYLEQEGEEGSEVWEMVELDSVSPTMIHPHTYRVCRILWEQSRRAMSNLWI